MRKVLFSSLILMCSSTGVLANACTDLVQQAEAALGSADISPDMRNELQRLLDVGRSGDLSQCEGATTSSLTQTPMPGAHPGGRICNKLPDTV